METLSNWLLWFGSLVGLGCVILSLVYLGTEQAATNDEARDEVQAFDDLLRCDCQAALLTRMSENGIHTWKALQEKTGLSHTTVGSLRKGDINGVNFSQLGQLAVALNWDTETLLHTFGVITPSRDVAPTQTEIVSQDKSEQDITSQPEVERLLKECSRLREQLEQQSREVTGEVRQEAFQQLISLLTNYPSAREMVQVKPDLPAKNIISLFTPLDNLLASWGYSPIGKAWEQVPYNPQLHQADSSDIAPSELVVVRFIGYRDGDRILCPAKVSRTLPGGAK